MQNPKIASTFLPVKIIAMTQKDQIRLEVSFEVQIGL